MTALSAAALSDLAGRIAVPSYDRSAVTPGVVHIGVGGFHRAHQALFHDRLLRRGHTDWGICGVGLLDADRAMRDALQAQDGLYTLVAKHAGGGDEGRVVGSLVEYRFAPDDPDAVIERMADPAIRIVSLTITEGGYEPDAPSDTFTLMAEALARRQARTLPPFTVVCCDNLQDSGAVTRNAVLAAAVRSGHAGLADWIATHGAFPGAMVDRITPATTDADRDAVRAQFGIDDRWPVVCEPYLQWVLEDDFCAGRPPYEDVGVQIVDVVEPYERMKVRLLNGGHQAIGYLGYLAGHRQVADAASDPLLRDFVLDYLREEAAPTLGEVPGVDLGEYRHSLLGRFANPRVGDSLARLCALASDRVPKFVLPVIHDRLQDGQPIDRGALIVAAWARYASGVDERGEPIDVVDARRETLVAAARRAPADPDAFVADREVFGDLGREPRFLAAYRTALRSLYAHGSRATLRAMAGR
jgi:mannitol 2-dehydrogenase